jgi:hypothetical protein
VIPSAKYAKSHEYANVEGDIATIGISDFAQVRTRPFPKLFGFSLVFSAAHLTAGVLFLSFCRPSWVMLCTSRSLL